MQPLISDIQTSSLLYFDGRFANECYQFCERRDIDYLPSIEFPRRAHRRVIDNHTFVDEEIRDHQIVDGQTRIFDDALVAQFSQQPLLFVHTGGYLSGVIHFSDYNRSAVSVYLYQTFFDFEKALRELLVLSGLCNLDMRDYFAQDARFKRKLSNFDDRRGVIDKAPPFQEFYLDDLIGLANLRDIASLRKEVVKLRNQVMHAHDHVALKDIGANNAIYDLASFEEFFKLCLILHLDLKRVRNRIAYLKSGIEELGICHGHQEVA